MITEQFSSEIESPYVDRAADRFIVSHVVGLRESEAREVSLTLSRHIRGTE